MIRRQVLLASAAATVAPPLHVIPFLPVADRPVASDAEFIAGLQAEIAASLWLSPEEVRAKFLATDLTVMRHALYDQWERMAEALTHA